MMNDAFHIGSSFMNDRFELSPWRLPAFANLPAWADGSRRVPYARLCADLDERAARVFAEDAVNVVDEGTPYENLLAYLTAWEQNQPLCLVPKTWPIALKNSVRDRIRNFGGELPAGCFYILPTSGSTGTPKLVVVTKANWQIFWNSLRSYYNWSAPTNVALCFEAVFDPFLAMVFTTLSGGGTLYPLPTQKRFDIFSFIAQEEIHVWASVPSLATLNFSRRTVHALPDLRLSIFTGEALSAEVVRLWQELAPNSCIDNLYGPVETTVWVTRQSFPAQTPLPEKISIGQPLSENVVTEVAAGELVIRGPQVALGYLRESGLHAFSGTYRTGDRAVEEDGKLFLLGRTDHQVKVLGQRIELEAIETRFLECTGSFAVCCIDEGSHLCLVAERSVPLERVTRALKESLPPSHVPRFYFHCPTWPTTSSGKLDREAIRQQVSARTLPFLSDAVDPVKKVP
jgi:D-alanine--poly(phosphoribitol) ligase subunit 1